MRIILCTDELCLARMLAIVLEGCELRTCKTAERVIALAAACSEDVFIDGALKLNDAFWKMLESSPRHRLHYVLVRSALTERDWQRARALGLSGFLTDPLSAIRTFIGGDAQTFLKRFRVPDGLPSLPPVSVNLGLGVHYKQNERCLLIEHRLVPLSEMEAKLLDLLISREDEVVSRDEIAQALWQGHVNPKGIAKLVSRLRCKLGPAGILVQGLRQGGYVYRRTSAR
ncbi:putative two component transcriptional regulator, winged helix family [Alicyclobacillus acidocaldarius subsp. acidocaldarius Tc-4-1]|uniref:Putative two component transcriptional regulator, winged helix family n=2 Tax=Alicyclobacillus acidocaldarius TaxID=405212 RepID=F8IDX1_ALIAT|nr:putative two component transcriptional regulator, winged helix family [Alicyclobacillus acidocaldarius subsp. acidocaldarius Tc-4-1]